MDKDLARRPESVFAGLLGLLVFFSAMEEGAHDLWAATLVHLCVMGLFLGAAVWASLSRRSPGLAVPAAAPLGVFALVLTASAGLGVNPGEAVLALKDWLAALAVFLLAARIFMSDGPLKVFLAFLPPVFLVQLGVSLFQRSFQGHFFMEAPPGTLGNANLTAAFLIIWVPVFADLAWKSRKPHWVAGLALNVASLLLSFTMWGFFCLLLGGLAWLAGLWGRRWLSRHARLAGALAAGAAALIAVLAWWKLNRTYNWEGHPIPSGTQTSRLMWWASALRMFSARPWLGVGLGNYTSAYLAYKVGGGQNTLFAHSFPLGLLAETGALGCAAFLSFLAAWAGALKSGWDKTVRRWPFLLGAGMFLAFGMISLSAEYLVNLLVFWAFLGIAAAPAAREFRRWRPMALVVAVLLALAAVPYIAAPFLASRVWVSADEKLARGEAEAAAAGYAAAASMDPLSFEAERGWARADFLRRDIEGAVRHARRAAALDRLDAALWRDLGTYLHLAGREAEARESFGRAKDPGARP